MPNNRITTLFQGCNGRAKVPNLIHPLGINVNLPAVLKCEALDLLNDALFCPVLTVQKWRDYGEAQVRSAFLRVNKGRRPNFPTNLEERTRIRGHRKHFALVLKPKQRKKGRKKKSSYKSSLADPGR